MRGLSRGGQLDPDITAFLRISRSTISRTDCRCTCMDTPEEQEMVKANFSVVINNTPVAYTGSTVSGHISADVQQEIKGSSLSVEFYGKEKTCVRYTTRSNDKTRTHYAHGERNLIRISLRVDQLQDFIQDGSVQPGRYVLPFQFSLPSDLPTSFEHSSGSEYAKIQYKVKAILRGSGWIRDYQCESHVPISSCHPIAPVPFQGEPSTSVVDACCWNRGLMTLGAHMDTTTIGKGQSANVAFACHNNSTAKVECVRARLSQRMTWRARSHTSRSRRVLCEVLFPITVGLKSIPEEEKFRKRSAESVRNENLSIIEELRTGSNTRKVSLPLGAISSYMGSIIQVTHDLILEVRTGCCIANPTVRIPILCCDAQIPEQMESTEPLPDEKVSGGTQVLPSAPIQPINNTNYDLDTVYAEPISLGASHTIMGGSPFLGGSGVGEEEALVPPMANATSLDGPDLSILLQKMQNSVGEISLVRELMDEPAWCSFFTSLSPAQFALVVSSVQSSFAETGMATLLAQSIDCFTCEHVVQAVGKASDFSRTNLVEKLLLFCTDFETNHVQIKTVLTEWERTVTERAFDKELDRRRE